MNIKKKRLKYIMILRKIKIFFELSILSNKCKVKNSELKSSKFKQNYVKLCHNSEENNLIYVKKWFPPFIMDLYTKKKQVHININSKNIL